MKSKKLAYCIIPLTICPALAMADAGSALRTYKDTTILEPGKKQPEEMQQVIPGASAEDIDRTVAKGPAVHIASINVVGNTVLSTQELDATLAPFINRHLSTQEIHAAADKLMQAIRAKAVTPGGS